MCDAPAGAGVAGVPKSAFVAASSGWGALHADGFTVRASRDDEGAELAGVGRGFRVFEFGEVDVDVVGVVALFDTVRRFSWAFRRHCSDGTSLQKTGAPNRPERLNAAVA